MDKHELKAVFFGLAAVGCWSTVATAFKVALAYLDTVQLLFYATLTASLVLFVVTLARSGLGKLVDAARRHWRMALVAGLLNPVIYYQVLFSAYDLLPAQVAMSINYSWAIVLTLMAAVFLKQRIRRADYVAAVVCYLGVLVIATRGDFSRVPAADFAGVALAVGSTIVWAGYWILNVRDQREPALALCLNFLVALPITAIICGVFSSFQVPIAGLAAAGYVGAVEMALGFLLWSNALRLSSNAARISNLIFLSPFISLLLIYLVLGEPVYPATLVGLFLIIGGLLGQQWAHSRLEVEKR